MIRLERKERTVCPAYECVNFRRIGAVIMQVLNVALPVRLCATSAPPALRRLCVRTAMSIAASPWLVHCRSSRSIFTCA